MAWALDRSAVTRLLARGALVLAGALVVTVSAYAALQLVPAGLDPDPGTSQVVTERVDYWTPEDGDQQFLRPRSDRVREAADGLQLVRRLEGPHSPRGGQFAVDLGDRWRLADEPAAHASFPPTPLWQEPPETVYMGVPWQTQTGVEVVWFDDFHRLGETEVDGMGLVEYRAREPNQFLVDGDEVWFRSAERTALVEPVSGTVVDYRIEETLRRAELADTPPFVPQLQSPREEAETVWEATIEPTPTSRRDLVQQAEDNRRSQLQDLLIVGLPALVAGEGLMWAGIVGRPKRWLGSPG